MYSLSSRVSAYSSFISTVTGFLLAAIALSCYYFSAEAPGKVNFKDIKISFGRHGSHFRDHNYIAGDYVLTKMDINTDLTGLFHWNTKQLFVYVVAEYSNANYSSNKVVVWDRIVRSPKKAHIQLKNEKLKYPLTDITPHLVNNQVTLRVHWDVIPWIGIFRAGQSEEVSGPIELLPPNKPKKRKLVEEKTDKVKSSYENLH